MEEKISRNKLVSDELDDRDFDNVLTANKRIGRNNISKVSHCNYKLGSDGIKTKTFEFLPSSYIGNIVVEDASLIQWKSSEKVLDGSVNSDLGRKDDDGHVVVAPHILDPVSVTKVSRKPDVKNSGQDYKSYDDKK